MNKLSLYTAVLYCLAAPIPCAAYADSSEPSATAEVIRMDSWRGTQEMANNAKVSLAEAFAIAKKEAWNRRGRHAHFRHVFSKEGRYFFLDTFDMDKIHGVMPALQELGVYVDSETGRAEYVQSKREFPPPDSKSEYFKNPLNKQLQFLESQYNKQRKENEKSASAAEEIAVQKVSTGNTARNIREIAKDKHGALAVALNDLADREEKKEEKKGCGGASHYVHSIVYYKDGEASARSVWKNGRVENAPSGTKLPACYAICLVLSEKALGGSGTYFYDAATGTLLGMTLYR